MIEISKAVIRRGNAYLLLKRASHTLSFPDSWDFAGGKHEPGESPEKSVVRETKEETGFIVNPGKKLWTAEYKNQDYDLLFHYFIPAPPAGEPVISLDHSKYGWFTEEEIPHLALHPSVHLFFKHPAG